MTGTRLAAIAVVIAVAAARLHLTFVVYGCPVSVPFLPFAAAVTGLLFAAAVAAVRWVVRRNRMPRICWLAVTP